MTWTSSGPLNVNATRIVRPKTVPSAIQRPARPDSAMPRSSVSKTASTIATVTPWAAMWVTFSSCRDEPHLKIVIRFSGTSSLQGPSERDERERRMEPKRGLEPPTY